MCPLSQRYIGVEVGGERHTGHSKIFFNPSIDIGSSSSSGIGRAAAIWHAFDLTQWQNSTIYLTMIDVSLIRNDRPTGIM